VSAVEQEIRDLDEVNATSAEARSLGAALMIIQGAAGVLSSASTALPIVHKLVEAIRGRGVQGAKIELPDGTKISVDSASADEIERLVQAATAR
jgi:ferric-dicitrate binding protein FerR (iron transport regulator)